MVFSSNSEEISKYKHGGDVYGAMRLLNCELKDLVDFSANINPLVTQAWLKEKLEPYWERVLHYPDPDNSALVGAIAQMHNVSEARVVLGSGATPLIHQIVEALRPDVAALSAPTFGEYQKALDKLGTPVSYALCDPETLQFDIMDLANIPCEEGQSGLVFLCNPNNPTGQSFKVTEVLELLVRLPKGCKLVVDEAFIEFTAMGESNSLAPYLGQFENLIILRSATKFYGMPGLRLGYVLCGDLALGKALREKAPIWQINVFAEGLFLSAYGDEAFKEQTNQAIQLERKAFQEALRDLSFRVWESDANYFMVKPPEVTNLQSALLEKGILIRSCDNYIGIPKGYYRLAVKTLEARERFLNSFTEIAFILHKGIENNA